MPPINPISPNIQPVNAPVAKPTAPMYIGEGRIDFASTLRRCVEQADGDQQASAKAVQDLLSGRTDDVVPVVAAVAKADMSFKLLMGVRNKVIEAYRQTMNMQI